MPSNEPPTACSSQTTSVGDAVSSVRNRLSVHVSADEIDFVAAMRAPHLDERRRMLQLIVKEPRCLYGQVDASAAAGTRDHSRVVDRAILAPGIVGNGVES